MGTWDDLFDKAKVVADTATKVTGEVVEVSKNKLQALKLANNIQKVYEKLGAAVYEAEKSGEDISRQKALYISEIDGLLAQLKEVNDRMNSGKATHPCGNCGYGNAADSIYCAHCGAKMKPTYDAAEVIEVSVD